MSRTAVLFLFLLFLLGLSSCATTPPPQPSFQDPVTPAKTTAERQRYLDMAREYTRLATDSPAPLRQDYQLRAANILALANFTRHARQILDSIPESVLDESQRIRKRLLGAYIAILEHKPSEALQLLRTPLPASAPPARQADFHRLRATAFSMEGKHLHSARERVALERFLTDRNAIEKNHQAIWQSLSRVDDRSLAQVKTLPPPHVLSGWIELMRISKFAHRNSRAMKEKLQQWQAAFPNHPASGAILAALYEQSERSLALNPRNIALLLPLSGNLRPAGEAIQNGFISAYYNRVQEGQDEQRQRVRIYDAAAATDIRELYQRAAAEGSDLVVGPLDKAKLAKLAESGALTLPTLALNYLDPHSDYASDTLFQLGLSPEDEARQVAQRIWRDGHNKVGILYPDNLWGQRVASAFIAEWEKKSGGRIVASQPYDVEGPDFSTPVARLLKSAAENAPPELKTPKEPEKNEVAEEPENKAPTGIDAVFMPGYPRQLRQLRPQLRFHDAGELPVYATSLAFTGKPNPAMDNDLNGVIFCDMPWILDTDAGNRRLRRAIKKYFDIVPDSQLNRLYALGVDAYNVIFALASLQSQPYQRFDGETGTLMMDDRGRLHRRLSWAIFERGVPRLLPDTSPDTE